MLGRDLAGGFDAIEIGHLDIHEHDIGFEGGGLLDRLGAIRRLADDRYPLVFVQQSGQPRAKERLIVGDQDPSHLRRRLCAHRRSSSFVLNRGLACRGAHPSGVHPGVNDARNRHKN